MVARATTPRGAGIVIASVSTSITIAAGLLITVVDSDNFPSLGSGLWWAVQTVTTVGYGDHVPTTVSGQFLAALVMLLGIGFLTVITAAITSTFVSRSHELPAAADTSTTEQLSDAGVRTAEPSSEADARTAEQLREMNERLERIETALSLSA